MKTGSGFSSCGDSERENDSFFVFNTKKSDVTGSNFVVVDVVVVVVDDDNGDGDDEVFGVDEGVDDDDVDNCCKENVC
jgi:hypothetical protein